ncbi:ABC transporter permease [Actinospica robiniae]|uniref:ABC transporter permease n=1 Tax=Actinospica robiniae TaxID=304901 RepID=UPI0004201F14|nr:ABC transporter permease [Actinospica robiniae]
MSAPTLSPAPAPTGGAGLASAANRLRRLASTPEAGVVLACVVTFIVFALAAKTYSSTANMQVMGRDLAQAGILAIGESFVILTGGIDLSVGGLAGLAGMITGWLAVNNNMPAPLAILVTLLFCAGVGYFHGAMINRLDVPPFIITLVTFTIAKGLATHITAGTPIANLPNLFGDISLYYVGPVPVTTVLFAIVAVVAWFVLERTYMGRQIYALGGNPEAARLAGIPVGRRRTTTYITSSVLAGVAGILIMGRLGVADASVSTTGYELTAIAAAVVGGVSLFGGEGRILGIAAGAILLELIGGGLNSLNVSSYDIIMIQGAVLGVAVIADRVRAKYFGASRR